MIKLFLLKNGIQILKINQQNNMGTIKKLLYLVLALSLLPIIVTYFAYGGNPMEIVHFFSTLLFFIGLILLTFSKSKAVTVGTLICGIVTFLIQLIHLKHLWFNNEGGDIRVPIAFSFQIVFMLIVLVLMWNENKKLSSN